MIKVGYGIGMGKKPAERFVTVGKSLMKIRKRIGQGDYPAIPQIIH